MSRPKPSFLELRLWEIRHAIASITWDEFNGCHICTSHRSNKAQNMYPRIQIRKMTFPVHRLLWFAKYGELPPGYVLSSTCGVWGCINLDHYRVIRKTDVPLVKMHHSAPHPRERAPAGCSCTIDAIGDLIAQVLPDISGQCLR